MVKCRSCGEELTTDEDYLTIARCRNWKCRECQVPKSV